MLAGGFHQPGDLVRVLPAIPQQHEKRADLMRIGLASEHHGERLPRLLACQGAAAAWPAA